MVVGGRGIGIVGEWFVSFYIETSRPVAILPPLQGHLPMPRARVDNAGAVLPVASRGLTHFGSNRCLLLQSETVSPEGAPSSVPSFQFHVRLLSRPVYAGWLPVWLPVVHVLACGTGL